MAAPIGNRTMEHSFWVGAVRATQEYVEQPNGVLKQGVTLHLRSVLRQEDDGIVVYADELAAVLDWHAGLPKEVP